MRAIDTNVVIRFLTNDHPEQSERARTAVLAGDIYMSLTVCLESEWVLRSAYRRQREEIADKLEEIAGLPGVLVEDPEALASAIAGLRAGMDFADALHLACAAQCDVLLSFDTKLAALAGRLGTLPVVQP